MEYDENLHNNAQGSTYENAKYLRSNLTIAEEKLWDAIRNKKVDNLKFRRQHPFGQFILDFYCHEIKLCIEVDGSIHLEKDIAAYDIHRTKILNEANITVIRFSNEEIESNINNCIEKIKQWNYDNGPTFPLPPLPEK